MAANRSTEVETSSYAVGSLFSSGRKQAFGKTSKRGAGLVRRWLLSVGIIVCLFLTEGLVLRLMGFQYTPHQAVANYWIPKDSLSVDSSGQRMVARTLSRMQHKKHGLEISTIRIGLNDMRAVESDFATLPSEAITISPSGDWVAVSQWDGSVRVSSYEDQRSNHSFQVESNESIVRMLFSPDEQYLAALGDRHVYLWSWPDRRLLWKRRITSQLPSPFAFSSDSKSLLFRRDRNHLICCGTQPGQTTEPVFKCSKTCLDAIWCARSQDWLLLLQEQEGISVRQARQDTSYLDFTDAQIGPAASIAFSHDRIAYMDRDRRVTIRSLGTGALVCVITQAASTPFGLTFAGDDKLLRWDSDGNVSCFRAETGYLDSSLNLQLASGTFSKP